ncbi:MAG: hypothetical protein ACI8QD_001226 [Cyclobacteriaceae bacterium]
MKEEFDVFLKSKKIDPVKFEKSERASYEEFFLLFQQMHPSSLVAQKLYLINKIRRKHTLKDSSDEPLKKKPAMTRPKITPKIK